MPETHDLDDRIRELVAHAVADAPAPPQLDPGSVPLAEPAPPGRHWWIGGGAAVLAAAALVTAFVLVGDSDDSVSTPATEPTGAPTTTPATPAPTTTPPSADEPWSLTAGPEGVYANGGPLSGRLTGEPMVMALDAGDGRVIVQRRSGDGTGQGWTDADTVPLVLRADGSLSDLFGTADWDGGVVLHDIEVVEGRRLLLFSVQVAMSDPEAADESLYVVDLETQERTEVAAGIGGWESGTGRLTLATTGLIVGEWSAEASSGIFIDDVPIPGFAASLPTPEDLGLEESYTDCADCPHGFTVTPDGATVAWMDGNELVIDEIYGDFEERIALSFTAGCCGSLDVLAVNGLFLWSPTIPEGSQAPVLINPDGIASPLEGVIATWNPAAVPASPPGGTPATTVPTATLPLPVTTVPQAAAPAGEDAVVTAGPEGVVEHRKDGSRTLTTEAMVMALDAGDDRVIVQRRSGDGAGQGWTDADTAPLVLADDGSLAPLFGTVAWDGGVVLHDIEVVEGRRLLLFSLQVGVNVNMGGRETLYVVDLDDPAAGRTEIARIGGWEESTSRLHLATTGLIVGEQFPSPTQGPLILAVPGAPADLAGVPTPRGLGLEEQYRDCTDCPRGFTVSPDGSTVAWVQGDDPVLVTRSIEPSAAVDPFAALSDAAPRDVDLLPTGTAATISYFEPVSAGGPAPPPVRYDADGTVTTLEGAAATSVPLGGATSTPEDSGPACGVDPRAPAIVDHVTDVSPAFEGYVWTYEGDSNYDPCTALSYARLDVEGGTGSSPVQVMLFHEGDYIGTATECAFGFTTIVEATNDAVTVEYRWPREGDANAAPSGAATVTYRWDSGAEAVQQEGELPQELLDVSACAG